MIIIGSDHAGYALKKAVIAHLKETNVEFIEAGCMDGESVDYPLVAKEVCERIVKGEFEKGILICGTGIGISMAANKVKGIRAGLVFNTESARLTREHNDTNVLVIPGKYMPVDEAKEACRIWLTTDFSGEERHARRIAKIAEIEAKYFK